MLTSVDLFTGIGGFTLALHDVCRPLLYCDIDAFARAVLVHNMAIGRLPEAPVLSDVRDTSAIIDTLAGRRVDVVTMGFPCIGFSICGQRAGLGNVHSALLLDALTIIWTVRPSLVFMENTTSIMAQSHSVEFAVILKAFRDHRYAMRWTTCAASDVGAPHRRSRWYGMAFDVLTPSLAAKFTLTIGDHSPPCFGDISIPPATTPKTNSGNMAVKRCSALGNAIVPLAGRQAFARLFTGFSVQTLSDLLRTSTLVYAHASRPAQTGEILRRDHLGVRHGISTIHGDVRRSTFDVRPVDKATVRQYVFCVDPDHYVIPENCRTAPTRSAALIVTRRYLPQLTTPRVSATSCSHVLTARTVRDLVTVVLFLSSIDGVNQVPTSHTRRLNPQFVEFMMGYEVGYTGGFTD